MKLLTQSQLEKLIANGKAQRDVRGTSREIDFHPVVKLFNPVGAATWLLTEVEPDEPRIAWGLADLGMDCVEFGTIDLDELRAYRGPLGLGIERDIHWQAKGPLSAYLQAASKGNRIVDIPHVEASASERKDMEG